MNLVVLLVFLQLVSLGGFLSLDFGLCCLSLVYIEVAMFVHNPLLPLLLPALLLLQSIQCTRIPPAQPQTHTYHHSNNIIIATTQFSPDFPQPGTVLSSKQAQGKLCACLCVRGVNICKRQRESVARVFS